MSVYVDIEKRLGDFLLKVKFQAENETVALLGASGCGKTMTLKCIAGIEKPDRGKILVDGVTLFDSEKRIDLSPQERKTGLMFQNYALFPNMTVLQNLAAGAKREKNKAIRNERIERVLDTFDLREFSNRLPSTLSGGQQQRVALARILVSEPNILLLDEPFSALDSHLRLSLEQEVRQVIRQFGKTVILVSHDRDEVYRMSEHVAIMSEGHIVEYGNKRCIFEQPASLAGARLTGCENIIPVEEATHWGIYETFSSEIRYLGIRAEDPVIDTIGQEFRVIEQIESPNHATLQLMSVDPSGVSPLLWTPPAPVAYNPGDIMKIRLPINKLLPLRDGSEREMP